MELMKLNEADDIELVPLFPVSLSEDNKQSLSSSIWKDKNSHQEHVQFTSNLGLFINQQIMCKLTCWTVPSFSLLWFSIKTILLWCPRWMFYVLWSKSAPPDSVSPPTEWKYAPSCI